MIDWERVAALRDEVGPEDFDEVVEIFLEEVDAEIGALDAALPQPELEAKLHFLKGSALNLGFSDFSGLCQQGEIGLKNNSGGAVDLDQITSTYFASRDAFLTELPQRLAI
jgi:HPt (histidine-containing phosphotransfer) domain-containing protein